MVSPLQLNGKTYSINSLSHPFFQAQINEMVKSKWYEVPIPEVGTIIDAGANIGLYSLYMSEFAKTVYAIEPFTQSYDFLKKNIEDNKKENIKAYKIGFAGTSGTRTIYSSFTPNDPSGFSLLPVGNPLEKVHTKTIAEFMRDEKIDLVHIFKTDIEGLEQEIFSSDDFGDVAPKILTIVGEYHLQCPNLREVLEYHGYDYSVKANGIFTAVRSVKKTDILLP